MTSPDLRITVTPAQEDFLRAVFSGYYRYLGYGGGIRGGKTWAVLIAILLLCKAFPRSRWAIVRTDLPTLRRNTMPSFTKLRSAAFCGPIRKDDWTVTCRNGSQIIFFPESLDTDPDYDRWKGLEVNGFVLEEGNELAPGTFQMAIMRAGSWIIPPTPEDPAPRQPPPLILCTFNPAPGWVKYTFYDPWVKGLLKAPYYFRQALITDNPHLPPEYLDSLKNLTPAEYDRFVRGIWDQLTGRALDLNARVHLVNPFRVPDHWTRFGGFDWGYRHLFAFGDFAVNEDGSVFLVDTVRGQRLQPDGIADRIRAKVPLKRLEYVDAGWDLWDVHQARGVSGPTLAEQFTTLGIPALRKARRDRVQGLMALRWALAYQTPDGSVRDPVLRLMRTPGNLWLFDHLGEQVLDDSGEDVKKTDSDDQGRGGDDGYDMTRYAMAGRWSPAGDVVDPNLDLTDPLALRLEAAAQRQVSRYGRSAGEARQQAEGGINDPELGGWI